MLLCTVNRLSMWTEKWQNFFYSYFCMLVCFCDIFLLTSWGYFLCMKLSEVMLLRVHVIYPTGRLVLSASFYFFLEFMITTSSSRMYTGFLDTCNHHILPCTLTYSEKRLCAKQTCQCIFLFHKVASVVLCIFSMNPGQ